VKRSDITEFHYITPIANVPSILVNGIVCHTRAKTVPHLSVAMEKVQAKRANRSVPSGHPLHSYANLYFTARNPMLYVLRDHHRDLAVLRIDPSILDLPEVVIADGNASSEYTRFYPSPTGLSNLRDELIFAEYWTDDDLFEYWNKKRIKCAEVLVPDQVDPSLIMSSYVSGRESEVRLRELGITHPIDIRPWLFFR
jgi:hypothetical protein